MRLSAKHVPLTLLVFAALFFSQCKKEESAAAPAPAAVIFTEDKSLQFSPERGWYRNVKVEEATLNELTAIANQKISLILLEVRLVDFLDKPIDNKTLTAIEQAFYTVERAGLSVIFRASYDFSGRINPEPHDIDIILKHIDQLGDIFTKHENVLFAVQAGILGAWGEWLSSYYGTERNSPVKPEFQRLIANALLEAVPENVMVALRRPEYIRNITDESAVNNERGDHAPVTVNEAFGASKIARLGFHNDALMSDETDLNTYAAPGYPRETELDWINQQTRYTPMIGETNTLSNYNDAENAVAFLDRVNITSLNRDYYPGVMKKWQDAAYGGMSTYAYIGLMMGYRFVIKRADLSETAEHGGSLCVDLEIENIGFGRLLKKKNFELVLKKGRDTFRAEIAEDARFWNKNEPVNRKYYFSLPSNLDPGQWDVYLSLSSTFKNLADKPAYSVRFANKDIWDGENGLNRIGSVNLTKAGQRGNGRKLSQVIP